MLELPKAAIRAPTAETAAKRLVFMLFEPLKIMCVFFVGQRTGARREGTSPVLAVPVI